jgi:HEAT repeat protein
LQIQQRLDRHDGSAKQWYPEVIRLSSNPETELRLTVAWLMGFDNQASEFHNALLKLLSDPEPIVRRNAALALIRFNDASGRHELKALLEPYPVRAPAAGVVSSSLRAGSQLSRGTLLARLLQTDNRMQEVRSPLTGKVVELKAQSGARVEADEMILTLESDEESVWEALRGLALIGEQEDLLAIQRYLSQTTTASDRTKEQAALTIKAIQRRISEK